jgi:hypothetical protein
MSIKLTLLLLASVYLPMLQGAKIKINIRLPDDYAYSPQRNSRQAAATACSDKVVVDRSTLSLPGMLNRLNNRVQFFQSQYATNSINNFLDVAEVPGIDSFTVANVLQVLRNEGCPVFIYGGVVRDQFLGRAPNDVDVEVDCTIASVVNICKQNWRDDNCGKETDTITHIGTPLDPKAVDLAPTTSTFYASLSQLEFTANSLAYDTNGLDVIIDLTGNGVQDVCAKKIRIPSDDNSVASWDMWKAASPEPNKIYRFWKLRSKGFTAYNEETENYIVSSTQTAIDSDTPTGNQFKRFYCNALYGSYNYNSDRNTCSEKSDVCTANSGTALTYKMVLDDDLGGDYVTALELPKCGE